MPACSLAHFLEPAAVPDVCQHALGSRWEGWAGVGLTPLGRDPGCLHKATRGGGGCRLEALQAKGFPSSVIRPHAPGSRGGLWLPVALTVVLALYHVVDHVSSSQRVLLRRRGFFPWLSGSWAGHPAKAVSAPTCR